MATQKRRRALGALSCALATLACVLMLSPLALSARAGSAARSAIAANEAAAAEAGADSVSLAMERARDYNTALATGESDGVLPYAEQLLGQDPICEVSVPALGIGLPVYRGTSEEALSSGAGHVETTSLPVGGATSNCVIAAHSGLLTARMFDDLRQARTGDLVELHALGSKLCYRVEEIATVSPDDSAPLAVQEGRDLVTLVTCTPYGVNDHRLVVACERIAKPEDANAEPRAYVSERWKGAALLVAAAALAGGARALRRRWKRARRRSERSE